jgi:hypothetical protein
LCFLFVKKTPFIGEGGLWGTNIFYSRRSNRLLREGGSCGESCCEARVHMSV